MRQKLDTEREFSLMRSARSFVHATRGLCMFFKTTHNAWIQLTVFVLAIALGLLLDINRWEWIILIFVAGFVFVSEAFNTAIEIDINLTSPEYHPYAKDTKDVAAGAVLIASIVAVIIGMFIFIPNIIEMFL